MRTAASKTAKGQPLTQEEQKALAAYKLCEEYCKVAPTFDSPGVSTIYRGIKGSGVYGQQLMTLKPGDRWNLDGMPSSFSSKLGTASSFAGYKGGILLHMNTNSLKNATSIKGISKVSMEDEILVADYNLKIGHVSDQRKTGDGFYHIYLESA